jgi:hypothetical protein
MLKLTLTLFLAAIQSGNVTLQWVPVHNNHIEGLYVFIDGVHSTPLLAVEGVVNGVTAPVAKGSPESNTGFMPAPIGDLRSYSIKRMTIDADGKLWTLTDTRAGELHCLNH